MSRSIAIDIPPHARIGRTERRRVRRRGDWSLRRKLFCLVSLCAAAWAAMLTPFVM
jgi:hypothetical protein